MQLNTKKSLKDLGEEYTEHIETCQEYIDLWKVKIQTAKDAKDRDAQRTLRLELNVFYQMMRELKETRDILVHYYDV